MDENKRKEFNAAFGAFIKDARLNQKIQQGDAARNAGVTQAYYCYLEAGERNIDLQLAIKICDFLKLDLNDFIKTQE